MQDYICTGTFLKLARRIRKSTYLGISTPYRLIDLYSALELCATLQERHYQSEAQELGTR